MYYYPKNTSVRFNYGLREKVYQDILFYLGNNIREILIAYSKSKNEDEIKELIEKNEKIDKNLKFCDTIDGLNFNLVLNEIITNNNTTTITNDADSNENKFDLVYLFDTFSKDNRIRFTYDGEENYFFLKTVEVITTKPIQERVMGNYSLYNSFEIEYNSSYHNIFEKFVKKAKEYKSKYFYCDNDLDKNIKIYVNADDGGYFTELGLRPKRSLETIYLPKKDKDSIVQDLEKFLLPTTRSRYEKLGVTYKRTYLFEGIPGAGKSSFITALASKFGYNIAIIHFTNKFTDTDFMRCMMSLNDLDNGKIFLILEDIDCIFQERKKNDENKNNITFSGILNSLDGISTPRNMICFITTNYKNNLDSALIRPGRVDYVLKFDYVNKEQVLDIFKVYNENAALTQAKEFYSAMKELNISVSMSLLQQYLLKYLDNPSDAIENVNEIKVIHESSQTGMDNTDKMFQ